MARVTGLVLLAVYFAGCASNIVLRRDPGAFTGTLGPLMRCEPTEKECQPDREFDTSRFNQARTTFFRLPDCAFGYQQILIEGSGLATVQCAAPPPAPHTPTIPTTTEGGGTTAAP
jgi:hypothetical protein